ncbi:MAG TPA: ankyrin repeat domain-containing protein [Verrucomicrobiae bacterium]|nr:ankyrin repeat domain-containing protein [Verrucomicrobiae bacterium]
MRQSALFHLPGLLALLLTMLGFGGSLSALAQAKVDFANDVQPILRENCFDCHGPSKQKAGLRLDRKSSALRAFARRVVPGNSANSMVYHRLIGSQYGPQMPPKAALKPEQVAVIKTWIDEGAAWPESLANEEDLPPVNPKAVAMVEALRSDDLHGFMKLARQDPSLLNTRGPGGSTPFMYAVLYADTTTIAKLLKLGADPNKQNDAHATALMWAARDLDKTRLLVKHGADVNVRSDDRRTPLMIAARHPGGVQTVKFLLDKGANPNPNTKPVAESSPLLEALTAGEEATARLLLERGADAQATAEQGLTMAVTTQCDQALDLLAAHITNKEAFTIALLNTAVFGNLKAVRLMLDHGADVNAVDPFGKTPLMYAAISDVFPVDVVQLLIQRGADVNAKSQHVKGGDSGLTVLDIAKLNGHRPIIELLEKAGAKASPETAVALHPRRDNSIRRAVQDSVVLLQRTDLEFAKGAGCTSCHNNSVAGMAVGLARTRGLHIDEQIASTQVRVNMDEIQAGRERLYQAYYAVPVGDMFSDFILGYQLVGLHAQNCQPDLNTDAAAIFIQSRQKSDGQWQYPHADMRPPLCLDYIAQTALSMRALQLYAPKPGKALYQQSIRRAAAWLAQAHSSNNEDRSWRLTGLAWAGTDRAATKKALQELLAEQRSDGGWSDLPSKPSTPYATGRSLVALANAGLPVSGPAYLRGVQWLLNTQEEDGSWYNKTRALGFQPYFDAGFPHGYDQWMSAAATSWAAMALTLSLPESGPLTARVR